MRTFIETVNEAASKGDIILMGYPFLVNNYIEDNIVKVKLIATDSNDLMDVKENEAKIKSEFKKYWKKAFKFDLYDDFKSKDKGDFIFDIITQDLHKYFVKRLKN